MTDVPNTATGPDVYETTKAIEQQLRMLGYTRGTVEWDGALAAARAYVGRHAPAMVTIGLEDARRLFDLATDSPLVCSGSFETDDVVVLRKLAALIGVDPNETTPDEFKSQYPHPHLPWTVREDRGFVYEWFDQAGVLVDDYAPGNRCIRRPETDAEWVARVAEETADTGCKVGPGGRPCGKAPDDPIHAAPRAAAEMGA